jgi:hypothetical protein
MPYVRVQWVGFYERVTLESKVDLLLGVSDEALVFGTFLRNKGRQKCDISCNRFEWTA